MRMNLPAPRAIRCLLFCIAVLLAVAIQPVAFAAKIPIKVIVLSGFEVGDDTGDPPGEFQYWVEREGLTGTLEVKGAPHPLRYNAAGLYGSVASNTRDKTLSPNMASELIMALALDPDLDLRNTYWLINGIAGIDPARGSIGSAVWSANVVDGDALREVADADMPKGWPYGLFAIGTSEPNTLPARKPEPGGWGGATLTYTMNYALNPVLAQWAYGLSKSNARLLDTKTLKAFRGQYTGYPAAQAPPTILLGGTLATARYWHGPARTKWARDWVRLWTDGKDDLYTVSMEQAMYVGTLQRMAAQGLVDFSRVMMLRTASNYTMPPPGLPVTATIGDESMGNAAALEAAYHTGSVVVHELLTNWSKYENRTPAP
jgi:purine nucleoside permease